MIRVVLASGNAGKLRELAALLAPAGFELVPQDALGVAAVPETGATFRDNALIKARHAARATGDCGNPTLEVDLVHDPLAPAETDRPALCALVRPL